MKDEIRLGSRVYLLPLLRGNGGGYTLPPAGDYVCLGIRKFRPGNGGRNDRKKLVRRLIINHSGYQTTLNRWRFCTTSLGHLGKERCVLCGLKMKEIPGHLRQRLNNTLQKTETED